MSKRASTSATYKRVRRRTSPELSPDPDSRLDESAMLEEDIPGGHPKQSRRNKLREVQGYRSDSSEDEYFTTARKARSAGNDANANGDRAGNDDEDADMFGDANVNNGNGAVQDDDDLSSDEDDLDGVSKRSKKVRFMELNEIEGQDLSVGENVDAERLNREVENFAVKHAQQQANNAKRKEIPVDEDDVENENVTEDIDPEIGLTGSRIHVPQLEAFNMRSDLEDGQFDASGNFIRRDDADSKIEEMHDVWLDSVSRRDIRAAAKADEVRRERERAADAERRRDEEERPVSALMGALLCELEATETPMEALQRLGPGKKKKWGNNKRKKQEVETDEEKEKERRRKESVETITDAADKLMTRGVPDIYDTAREQLLRLYTRDTGQDWKREDFVY
ncbi:hypothetical protein V1525DRAFT_406211 [Lipomyces kononenkoae]|uniref:Uncharacterized protein n=1 Tax=Lipomyces kononenkoae TaxID=34357 RepID=A0ACC3SYE3_LIPKO